MKLNIRYRSATYSQEGDHSLSLSNSRAYLVVHLHYYELNTCLRFQTSTHLHLLLPFLSGGELFFHLQNSPLGFFSETRAKFYAAELVLALEYLHDHGIIYRDLKPENILLDTAGHISLVDFGLCKDFQTDQIKDGKTNTFCGTAEYLGTRVT